MKVNKNNKRGSKAFTLIELLMVISVIALIAAMVFNSLRGARESARISNALVFQHQMHSLLGPDLVGWWNFDEGSGTTANDISGFGNNGTIIGATYVSGVPGTRGSALQFSGSTSHVTMTGTNAHLDFTHGEQFSYGAWFRAESFPSSWHGIISKMPSWGNGYNLQVGPSQNIACGIGIYVRTNWIPQTGVWYHVICSYNGTTMTLHVNGNRESSGVHNILTGNTNLRLGMFYTDGSLPFFGIIDDVRIYSRALTASEIQTLYAQTKDKYLTKEK